MKTGLLLVLLLVLCIGGSYARCRIRLWGTCILERRSGKAGQKINLPCKFKLLDQNIDGEISVEEVLTAFSGPDSPMYTKALTDIMHAIDRNGDGRVDMDEFTQSKLYLQQTRLFKSCV
ncbi:uncharacterized protein LOC125652654 [Ostrea edulis]|uniref:uncharacterized protein LOC125652654 n=1 Tax=Ostrea edulis TaxID=37623 RepID=UPI0020946EEC|nr:uncharacterized protein LOC125652654 [Ostrea edulis]